MKDLLLDSSLIVDTKKSLLYDIKLIKCGDYIQVYFLPSKKIKPNSSNNFDLKLRKIPKDPNDLKENNSNYEVSPIDKATIEQKNINRSKLECQRLAKANYQYWKTFITLTFEKNITNIKDANKRFRHFVNKIHRVEKDFKYLGVIEFQKRGAVHYHIFTNIDINDKRFIYEQEDNKKFKHIKYWIDGFTKVQSVSEDIKKIVGYISKYMTKDIDNRLFNSHRYFYSRNLIKPITNYIDSSNTKHLEFLTNLLANKKVIYENEYQNYFEEKIAFKEFL